MSEERAMMIREQRNLLLSNLCACYPSGLAGESLFLVLLGSFPDYTRLNCFKDMSYLEEKGYATRKNPRTGKPDPRCEWKEARWCLTAKGNEVANQLIDDPALEV